MRFDYSSSFYFFLVLGFALLPFSTAPDDGGVFSFGLPFLFVSAFFALVVFLYRFKAVDNKLVLLSAAYLLLIVLMTFFSPDLMKSVVRMAVNLVGYFVFLGVVSVLAIGRYSKETIARVGILSCCILAIYFLSNFALAAVANGIESVIVERYVGGAMSLPWGASNTIAQVLLLAFAFFSLIGERKKIDFVCLIVISVGIVFTFSRSVIFLMLLMYIVIFGAKFFVKFVGVLFIFVLLIGLLFQVDSSGFEVFIADRLDPEAIATGNSRLDVMGEKINYLIKNNFSPIGYYGSLSYFEFSAHNYWLTTLIEQSFLAVIISFLFFLYVAKKAFSKNIKIGLAFMVIMLALTVEDPHFTQPYIVIFWVLLAVLATNNNVRCPLPRSATCEA